MTTLLGSNLTLEADIRDCNKIYQTRITSITFKNRPVAISSLVLLKNVFRNDMQILHRNIKLANIH